MDMDCGSLGYYCTTSDQSQHQHMHQQAEDPRSYLANLRTVLPAGCYDVGLSWREYEHYEAPSNATQQLSVTCDPIAPSMESERQRP